MARTVTQIKQQIQTQLVTSFAAINITVDPTSWSKRNMMQVFCFVIATILAYFEQLIDIAVNSIETQISTNVAGSAIWIQQQMFKFQWSATIPQYVQMINNVPQYPIIDPTLQIIDSCSVNSPSLNNVIIKCATGSPLTALTNSQITAAQGYIDTIGIEGIQYTVESLPPDQISLNAQIWYDKQYTSTIKTTIINTINAFYVTMSQINFNGALKVSDIERLIRNVQGVEDVQIINMTARTDLTLYLVQDSKILHPSWSPNTGTAGYVIDETTSGQTLSDLLILTAV